MARDAMSRISPYAERLLDDYIYEQLGDATMRLRDAYGRVSGRPARKSLEDRRLRTQLSGAAVSLRRAALAAAGREPEPPSRLPKLLALLALAGAAVAFATRSRDGSADQGFPADPSPVSGVQSNGAVEYGGERLPAG